MLMCHFCFMQTAGVFTLKHEVSMRDTAFSSYVGNYVVQDGCSMSMYM